MKNSGIFGVAAGSLGIGMVLGLVTLLVGGFLTGCTSTLTGGGEWSVGMRNDNFLVFRSTVDGDKEGKTAEVKYEVSQNVWDMIGPKGPGPKGPSAGE